MILPSDSNMLTDFPTSNHSANSLKTAFLAFSHQK
jgi:hypothetical protein